MYTASPPPGGLNNGAGGSAPPQPAPALPQRARPPLLATRPTADAPRQLHSSQRRIYPLPIPHLHPPKGRSCSLVKPVCAHTQHTQHPLLPPHAGCSFSFSHIASSHNHSLVVIPSITVSSYNHSQTVISSARALSTIPQSQYALTRHRLAPIAHSNHHIAHLATRPCSLPAATAAASNPRPHRSSQHADGGASQWQSPCPSPQHE
jgi:hypothetical protein